jgi:hypothetical protein
MIHQRRGGKVRASLSGNFTLTLTLLVCLSLWVVSYFLSRSFPLEPHSAATDLWVVICRMLNSSKVAAYTTGVLMTVIVGVVCQGMNDTWMLTEVRTRVPILILLLLTSSNVGIQPFGEAIVTMLLVSLSLRELFQSYQLPVATGKQFNAGVYIGIAILLAPCMLWFVPLLWIGMYQFRSLSVKSFFASLTGVLIILWIALTWCVWKSDYMLFHKLLLSVSDFSFYRFTLDKASILLFVFFLFCTFVYMRHDAINKSVRVRQMRSFLANMSCWSLLMLLVYGGEAAFFIAMLSLPSSILLSCFIESMRFRSRFGAYYLLMIYCVCYYIFTYGVSN